MKKKGNNSSGMFKESQILLENGRARLKQKSSPSLQ
jgi:hypothetical protein